MPSSWSSSGRFVLQATGENNNTWGVILNQGAFQLIDDSIFGRLGFVLSGSKTLATANGATDEARMAFLDVTGGSGGSIVIPPVPKGYFLRNAAAGAVSVSAGGPAATFAPGDAGPCFSDGGAVYPMLIAGMTVHDFVNTAIAAGAAANLPPPTGNNGRVLMVRMTGAPPAETWVPDFIQTADVQGLQAALDAQTAAAAALADDLMGRILLF